MAKVWCLCTDLIGNIHIQFNTGFMCNSRKMKHTVCGTSECHIYSQSIHKCFFCHDISWTNVLFKHLHNLHTCMFCQTETFGIYCRNCTVALKAHTENFCQTVHRIGCIHTGTGTACRAYFINKFIYLFFCHCTCSMRTYRFKHAGKASFLTAHTAGKHRSAADKYCRNI